MSLKTVPFVRDIPSIYVPIDPHQQFHYPPISISLTLSLSLSLSLSLLFLTLFLLINPQIIVTLSPTFPLHFTFLSPYYYLP